MFSVNVPLPPEIERLAADLQSKLSGFDRVRHRHTLVCKRVGVDDLFGDDPRPPERPSAPDRLHRRLHPVLDGVGPFRVAVTGVDAFPAVDGAGAIAYLVVESPGLRRLHRRLCRVFDPVEGIEGVEYVPHVTLARGTPEDGSTAQLRGIDVEPVTWRVRSLDLYDAEFREVTRTVEIGSASG